MITMPNKWIRFERRAPKLGQRILVYRFRYPSFYGIQNYSDAPKEDEDYFDWWIPIPEFPEPYPETK